MTRRRDRIRRHLARRAAAPALAEVFTPVQLAAYRGWREAAEQALADRKDAGRAAELEQWRKTWGVR